MSVDVLLCSAPVISVVRPSPALGLLQAVLQERGVRVASLYLNLLFADRMARSERKARGKAAEPSPDWRLAVRALSRPTAGKAAGRAPCARIGRRDRAQGDGRALRHKAKPRSFFRRRSCPVARLLQ